MAGIYAWHIDWYKIDMRLVLPRVPTSYYWYKAHTQLRSYQTGLIFEEYISILIPVFDPLYQANTGKYHQLNNGYIFKG